MIADIHHGCRDGVSDWHRSHPPGHHSRMLWNRNLS